MVGGGGDDAGCFVYFSPVNPLCRYLRCKLVSRFLKRL